MEYTAIIIDDEPWSLIDICQSFLFEEFGFTVAGTFREPRKALHYIFKNPPDLIVTDICMPDITGIELMEEVRKKEIHSKIVVISGYNEFAYIQQALRLGALDYCLKPTDTKDVSITLSRIKKLLDNEKHTKTNAEQKEKKVFQQEIGFDDLVRYMELNFQKPLTLANLAKKFSLNPNYCCSLFRKHMNTSYSEYLTSLRINKAIEYIVHTDQTLENISSMVGYNDYPYFSRVFKQTIGFSPSFYRKNCCEEKV